MEKIRNDYFDNIKSVLITLVVIGHFLLPLESTRLKDGLVNVIYLFHMPMFIMVSGYFAKGMYAGKRFRWERIGKLLWLYLLFQIISGMTESLAAGQLWTANINFLRESGAPWYLLAMIWWYLEVFLLARFRAWAVLMAVIVIGILSGYGRHIGSFLVLSRTLSFGPFFWIGYYLTEDQVRNFRSWKGRWLMAVLALFLAVVTAVESNGTLKELFPIVYGMNYGRIGTLWSPASALVRFCAYGAAGIMILGVMAVVPRQRRVWTCLGERSLQIYILHRPIRDLMEAAGFYRAVTSRSRMTVVFVMAFSVALAICLSAPRITKLFRYVQDAPEKMFRLIGRNRF